MSEELIIKVVYIFLGLIGLGFVLVGWTEIRTFNKAIYLLVGILFIVAAALSLMGRICVISAGQQYVNYPRPLLKASKA